MRRQFYVLWLCVACAESPPGSTGTFSEIDFESAAVGDTFILRVRQPEPLEEGRLYPLIIQLDPTFAGLRQFDYTSGFVSESPEAEAIVVGIDYDNPSKRFRDYTVPKEPSDAFDDDEGADAFYTAIRDEILPYIEAELPIDPTRRYLFGHSNGSIFSWYTVFRGDDLFAGVVAADGGYPQSLFTLERWHAEGRDDLPVRIYATRAYTNGPVQTLSFDGLLERLQRRGYPNLELRSEELQTDHGGAVAPSYQTGVEWLLGEAQ